MLFGRPPTIIPAAEISSASILYLASSAEERSSPDFKVSARSTSHRYTDLEWRCLEKWREQFPPTRMGVVREGWRACRVTNQPSSGSRRKCDHRLCAPSHVLRHPRRAQRERDGGDHSIAVINRFPTVNLRDRSSPLPPRPFVPLRRARRRRCAASRWRVTCTRPRRSRPLRRIIRIIIFTQIMPRSARAKQRRGITIDMNIPVRRTIISRAYRFRRVISVRPDRCRIDLPYCGRPSDRWNTILSLPLGAQATVSIV